MAFWDQANALVGVVTGILGAQTVAFAKVLVTGRSQTKQIQAKTRQVEGQIPLDSAESAVLIMKGVLERTDRDNRRLVEENARVVAENERLSARNIRLEKSMEGMSRQLLDAHDLASRLSITLHEVQSKYDALQEEIHGSAAPPVVPPATA